MHFQTVRQAGRQSLKIETSLVILCWRINKLELRVALQTLGSFPWHRRNYFFRYPALVVGTKTAYTRTLRDQRPLRRVRRERSMIGEDTRQFSMSPKIYISILVSPRYRGEEAHINGGKVRLPHCPYPLR